MGTCDLVDTTFEPLRSYREHGVLSLDCVLDPTRLTVLVGRAYKGLIPVRIIT